jgi:AcrR family transcriptional regulator
MIGTSAKLPAHRPSRRAEIVEAAIRVFARSAFEGSTVADVADEAGVVAAAIYYHFDSKEDLLAEAVRAIASEIDAVVLVAQADAGSPEVRLARVVREVFDWADSHADAAKVFFLWSAGATPAVESIRRDFIDRRVEGTRVYRASTIVDTVELLAARTAIGASVAVSVAWLSQDYFPADTDRGELTDGLVDLVCSTLELRGAR